ncbi:MAG: hypothetical protein QS721_02110 [Candidatus Endonucleobacter sp. (ex Gigantidas childressi)]|nr:hypothetical protein [Candidatus Endonucleobacter sp. (ex Gigantidas childressi)]
MKYQQLTEGDRYMIVALKWQGLSFYTATSELGHRNLGVLSNCGKLKLTTK